MVILESCQESQIEDYEDARYIVVSLKSHMLILEQYQEFEVCKKII